MSICIARGSRSRGGSSREDSYWRIVFNDVLLVSFFETKDDLVIFNDPVIDVVPAIASFPQSFVGHNISMKTRDVRHFFQLE